MTPMTTAVAFDKFKLLFQIQCLMNIVKPVDDDHDQFAADFSWMRRTLDAHQIPHRLNSYHVEGFKMVCMEFEGQVWSPRWGFDALNNWLDLVRLKHQEHLLVKKEVPYPHVKSTKPSRFEQFWEMASSQQEGHPYVVLNKFGSDNVFVEAVCSYSSQINAQSHFSGVDASDDVTFIDLNALPGLSIDEMYAMTTLSMCMESVKIRPVDEEGNRVFSHEDVLVIKSSNNFQERINQLLDHHQEDGSDFIIYARRWTNLKDASGLWTPATVMRLKLDLNNKEVQQSILNVVQAQGFLNRVITATGEQSHYLYKDENVLFAQTMRFTNSSLPNPFMINIDEIKDLSFPQLPKLANERLVKRVEQIRLAEELQKTIKKVPVANSCIPKPGSGRF